MTVIQFPVFVKGQTLTDDDLNELRDFLEEIDRRTAGSIGFGINCGLGGSVTGTTLTIGTGHRDRPARQCRWNSMRRSITVGATSPDPFARPAAGVPRHGTRRLHPGPDASTDRGPGRAL